MENSSRSKEIFSFVKKAKLENEPAPVFIKSASLDSISEELQYHIDNNIPLSSNIFRIYSKAFYNIFNESRELWKAGSLKVESSEDKFLLRTDIGKFGKLNDGTIVPLDLPIPIEYWSEKVSFASEKKKTPKVNSPRRVRKGDPGYGRKKFIVHVKDPSTGRVKTVTFGDPNLSIKGSSPERRKSFLARHNCDSPGPRTKARWWSCNLHRYKKQLGLTFEGRW